MKRIQLVNQYKKIIWECTTTCNYSCTYCPPQNSDGKYRWPNEEQTANLIDFSKNFYSNVDINSTDFDVMGGEPTMWPAFSEFCEEMSKHCLVGLSTNGSRTERYWKKLKITNPFRYFVISFHPETADIDHVINVAKIMYEKTPAITIFVLYLPSYKQKCLELYNRVKNSDLRISIKLKPIYSTLRFKPNYTSEDWKVIQETERVGRRWPDEDMERVFPDVTIKNPAIDLDGMVYENLDHLENNQQNNFKNWLCHIGTDLIYIGPDGNVRGSACGVSKYLKRKPLANAYKDKTFIKPKAVICPYSECHCPADAEILKKVNIFNQPQRVAHDPDKHIKNALAS